MICTLSATVCCFLTLIWLLNSEMFENLKILSKSTYWGWNTGVSSYQESIVWGKRIVIDWHKYYRCEEMINVEWISVESINKPKPTKPKVTLTAHQKKVNYYLEHGKMWVRYDLIDSGFPSHWLRAWDKFSTPITERVETKQVSDCFWQLAENMTKD